MPPDPADIEAQVYRQAGLARKLKTTRQYAQPHPSRGGSSGYSLWFRQDQLARAAEGQEVSVSKSSIHRWQKRPEPYRMTGNSGRTVIVGHHMTLLATFLLAYPDAVADEIAAFLYNRTGRLYTNSCIYKRMKDLQITKKKASIDAYQRLSERVQFRVWAFFNCPPGLGIVGIPRRKFIDVDEFGISLEKANRKFAWAPTCFRIRKDGHYQHGVKITVLFAIEPGDPALPPATRGCVKRPRRWIRSVPGGGTTSEVFRDFVDHICTDIEVNGHAGTDDHRVFLWDNLAAHHSPIVNNAVYLRAGPREFSIVRRPQYHPEFGPIEYKICDLCEQIQLRKRKDWTDQILEQELPRIANTLQGFNATFEHCGYPV